MNNPLMAGRTQPTQALSPMQMLQQIKANPAQFFQKMGMQIPNNILNDPNAILQHLMQSGRVSQQQINAAYQTAQRLGFK